MYINIVHDRFLKVKAYILNPIALINIKIKFKNINLMHKVKPLNLKAEFATRI